MTNFEKPATTLAEQGRVGVTGGGEQGLLAGDQRGMAPGLRPLT